MHPTTLRSLQWIAIILVITGIGVAYFLTRTKAAVTINTSQNTQQTANLVGLWSFNGPDVSGTTAYDRSSSPHNGTLTNGPTVIPGKVGQALNFNGTNQYVSVGNVGSGVQSISFWIKASNVTQKIIDLGGSANIEVIGQIITANGFTSPTIYVDGAVSSFIDTNWHFVTITTATGINASAVDIGRVGSGYFNGRLDEVRMYSTTVSSSQIANLYSSGGSVSGVIPPPIISAISFGTPSYTGATITWTTNTASTSYVEYGTTTGYGTTAGNATAVTSHSVALSGLTSATTYHFRVHSVNSSGQEGLSADNTFVTDGPTVAISAISSGTPAYDSTTITWTTDVTSDSYVDYGTTTGYGTTVGSATLVTSHSTALSGLTESTTYHFRVHSSKAGSFDGISGDNTFVTPVNPWQNVSACRVGGTGSGNTMLVYKSDVSGTYQWKTTTTSCISPQCSGSPAVLVADNTVDFSAYSARNACKAVGGRLPTVEELACIYTNKASYIGSFQVANYWSATESGATNAYYFAFNGGYQSSVGKDGGNYVRCVLTSIFPIISGVSISAVSSGTPLYDGTTITWTTDVTSTSYVEYGTTTGYGTTVGSATLVTSHSVALSGLTEGTTYHFRVHSTRASGQESISGDNTFVTTAWSCGTSVTFTYNGAPVTYGTVTGADSKCWMDRNLGATQVAVSSTDYLAYGSLFQWGRRADGHQLITWTSSTAGTAVNGSTATNADIPGDSLFITEGSSPYDWRVNQDGTLWANSSSTNNPCPTSWHVPTQTEWVTVVGFFSPQTSVGAFNSALKLTLAGGRNGSDAGLYAQSSYGYYWSSSPTGTNAYLLSFNSAGVIPANDRNRAYGFSVRCVHD